MKNQKGVNLFEEGKSYHGKNPEKAIERYNQIPEGHPIWGSARYNTALLQDDEEIQVKMLGEVPIGDQAYNISQHTLASIYMGLGELEVAQHHLFNVGNNYEYWWSRQMNQAQILQEAGDTETAIKLIKDTPEDYIHFGTVMLVLMDLHEANSDIENCVGVFERLTKNEGKWYDAKVKLLSLLQGITSDNPNYPLARNKIEELQK